MRLSVSRAADCCQIYLKSNSCWGELTHHHGGQLFDLQEVTGNAVEDVLSVCGRHNLPEGEDIRVCETGDGRRGENAGEMERKTQKERSF